jgi:hypothetical protein
MALLIAAAVIAQAVRSIGGAIQTGGDVVTTTANFFSFFTILSNVLSVAVLLWAAIWFFTRGPDSAFPGLREPRSVALALACVTTYMVITGIVYNTLLRGIPLPQGATVGWSNEILHVIGPLFLLLDLFLGPLRRRLRWSAIPAVLIFPIAWVVYTLIRGPLTTSPVTGDPYWYPYPFLDPNRFDNGYGTVALYVVGISVLFAIVATLVVWVGRRRGGEAAIEEPAASVSAV